MEYTENSTWATTENNSNKTNIIHKSRFRITTVTDTTSTVEREVEPASEGDTRGTADMHVVTLNTIVSENSDEKPMALDSISQEEVNKESNPQEKSHRTHIEKLGLEPDEGEAKNYIATDLPISSNNHPDGRNTVKNRLCTQL